MTEIEIIQTYNLEAPIYSVWGNYIRKQIMSDLHKIPNGLDLIKIEVIPRLKSIDSLLEKVFRPGKNYNNPYDEITDKIGLRFVVLLEKDIATIGSVIESNNIWVFSKDKDFEDERINSPTLFDYQSRHYILKNKMELKVDNIVIPQYTPCEIQIRTLLQHAYSELSHDTIYKPQTRITPETHRLVARSMALIETTDQLFLEVNKMISSDEKYLKEFEEIYRKLINDIPTYEKKVNLVILDTFNKYLTKDISILIYEYLSSQNWIVDIIKNKAEYNFFYRQPVIVFLLYIINNHRKAVKEQWPYTEDKLNPIYSDLGISI